MDDNENLHALLKWVDEVYPSTNQHGAACVEMTWGEYNALRAAIGLPPRKPTSIRRKPA